MDYSRKRAYCRGIILRIVQYSEYPACCWYSQLIQLVIAEMWPFAVNSCNSWLHSFVMSVHCVVRLLYKLLTVGVISCSTRGSNERAGGRVLSTIDSLMLCVTQIDMEKYRVHCQKVQPRLWSGLTATWLEQFLEDRCSAWAAQVWTSWHRRRRLDSFLKPVSDTHCFHVSTHPVDGAKALFFRLSLRYVTGQRHSSTRFPLTSFYLCLYIFALFVEPSCVDFINMVDISRIVL